MVSGDGAPGFAPIAATGGGGGAAAAAVRTVKLKALQLTDESWKPYGQIVGPAPDGKGFGSDDAQLELGRGIPRFYIMHLEERKSMRFGAITHLASVTQCLGSVGAHTWYLAVAPASIVRDHDGGHGLLQNDVAESGNITRSAAGHAYVPPSREDVRVFRVDGPRFLKLNAGTWHAGPFFTSVSMDFYNLELSDTNENDHTTHLFSENDHVVFQIDD